MRTSDGAKMNIEKCFEILGLKPGDSLEQAREAYKDLVKVWHPDRFAHDPKLQLKAQQKMQEINEAFQTAQEFLKNLDAYQAAGASNTSNSNTTGNTQNQSGQYTNRTTASSSNEGNRSSSETGIKPKKRSRFGFNKGTCFLVLFVVVGVTVGSKAGKFIGGELGELAGRREAERIRSQNPTTRQPASTMSHDSTNTVTDLVSRIFNKKGKIEGHAEFLTNDLYFNGVLIVPQQVSNLSNVDILLLERSAKVFAIDNQVLTECSGKLQSYKAVTLQELDEMGRTRSVSGEEMMSKLRAMGPLFDQCIYRRKLMLADYKKVEVKTNSEGNFVISDVYYGSYLLATNRGSIWCLASIDINAANVYVRLNNSNCSAVESKWE